MDISTRRFVYQFNLFSLMKLNDMKFKVTPRLPYFWNLVSLDLLQGKRKISRTFFKLAHDDRLQAKYDIKSLDIFNSALIFYRIVFNCGFLLNDKKRIIHIGSKTISKDHSGSSSGQSSNSGSKGGGSSAGGADGGKVKRGFPVFSEGQLPTVKEEKKSKGKYKKMATDNAVDDIPQELEASASKHTTVFYPTDPIPEAPSHEVFEVASSLDTTAISTTITTTAAANEECSLVPASMLVNSHDEAFIEKNDLEKMVSDLIKNNESKKQEIAALKMENNRLKVSVD
ncbi:hypothetical protein Avbf_01568 [Armadillidium vulgare]|nr:hypothetical protein Avbf_01568 [Armadillidium vulgare]